MTNPQFPANDPRSASLWSFRAWFSCAPGEVPTLLWVIGIHVAMIVGLLLLPLPPLSAVLVALAVLFIGGLGTTIVYHRALAHHAIRLNPIVEQVLIFFAMFNGSGSPRNWVAMHRHHHNFSDKEGDISSPHYGGFWWSHLRWLWQADQEGRERYVKDMTSFRYRFWTHVQILVLLLSVSFGALWFINGSVMDGLAAMLWIGPVRLVWALHTQCSVNSLCHLGKISDKGGSSRNIGWLALAHMGQGENWHANHHCSPADPRLGYRWQIDIGWWTICLLRGCRLATCKRQPAKRP